MARLSRPQLNAVALRGIALPLFLLALVLLPSRSAAQVVLYVVDNTDDSGAGSLREAIVLANSFGGDATVMFDLAPYSKTITLASTLPEITGHLTISGPGADKLIISGNDTVRVLELAGGADLTLENLTIAHGRHSSAGAGIYSEYASGAGSSSLTVTDCVFSGNKVIGHDDRGGAIYFYHYYHGSGVLTITGSTFTNNEAYSIVSYGGAIYAWATTDVANSTFVGNKTTPTQDWGFGSAIFAAGGSLSMTHSTVYGNTSTPGPNPEDPGHLSGAIHANDSVPVTFKNTIIANNPGGNCRGTITDGGGNLQYGDTTCGDTIPVSDPMLRPLADNGGSTPTMSLPLDSPAIDACACTSLATDQRGNFRPFDYRSVDNGGACDIGAYESGVRLYLPLVLRNG